MEISCYTSIKPLNAEFNLICHLLTLLGAHPIFHISRVRVKHKCLNFKNAKAPGEFTYKGIVHVISRFTNKFLEYDAFYLFWHTLETTILESFDDSLVFNSKRFLDCIHHLAL